MVLTCFVGDQTCRVMQIYVRYLEITREIVVDVEAGPRMGDRLLLLLTETQ